MNLKRHFSFIAAIVGVIVLCLYFDLAFPFVAGFLVALGTRKIVLSMRKATGLSQKTLGIVCLAFFYLSVAVFIIFLGKTIYDEIVEFLGYVPKFYEQKIFPAIKSFESAVMFVGKGTDLEKIFLKLFSDVQVKAGDVFGKLSINIAEKIAKYAAKIPDMLFSLMVLVISSFFFCADYEEICESILKYVPYKIRQKIQNIKRVFSQTVLKIIKSYFILFLLTALQLVVGLFLLNVKHFLIISVLIAILDVFPLVGTGSVLIPWAAIEFVNKNVPMSVGLVALFLIITLVRNVAEAKILGKNIGVHPLVSLITMYVGIKAGGIVFAVILLILAAMAKQYVQNKRCDAF